MSGLPGCQQPETPGGVCGTGAGGAPCGNYIGAWLLPHGGPTKVQYLLLRLVSSQCGYRYLVSSLAAQAQWPSDCAPWKCRLGEFIRIVPGPWSRLYCHAIPSHALKKVLVVYVNSEITLQSAAKRLIFLQADNAQIQAHMCISVFILFQEILENWQGRISTRERGR